MAARIRCLAVGRQPGRPEWADCVKEDFWLIVAPLRSNDEKPQRVVRPEPAPLPSEVHAIDLGPDAAALERSRISSRSNSASSVLRHSRRAWTLRTSARSFPPIKNASPVCGGGAKPRQKDGPERQSGARLAMMPIRREDTAKMGTRSLSPLRGRPLAKTRYFQGSRNHARKRTCHLRQTADSGPRPKRASYL